MATNSNYIVKPVDKALQVLTLLAEAGSELTLKDICLRTGLPKTTAFRYLHTLTARDYVAHNHETDLYRLGPQSWRLGQSSGRYARLLEVALPQMHVLRARFDETVNLAVLSHTDIVYLDMVESHHALRMQAQIGSHDPAYSTSLGKAMLAFLTEEQWLAHLPSQMNARTPHTLSSHTALRQELAQTRQRGYAIDLGENEEGACCLGAPILDRHGQPIAAISLSAPASRLTDDLVPSVAQAVVETATAISQQLTPSNAT